MTRLTPAQRNVGAEVRGVEEGHRAFVQPGGWIRVISDSYVGKSYRVDFRHTYGEDGDAVSFSCVPEGRHAFSDDHRAASARPGETPCKHAALAARRLEREGLAVVLPSGRWAPSPLALQQAVDRAALTDLEDPFEGLPR